MKYRGNHNELSKSRFKMISAHDDLRPLFKRIKRHIEEAKFDWVICLN